MAGPSYSTPGKHPTPKQLAELRQNLVDYLNEEELRTLCFDLDVDYENLPAQGKAGKVRELISYLRRAGRVSELVEQCRKLRPDVSWGDAPQVNRNSFTNLQTEPQTHKLRTELKSEVELAPNSFSPLPVTSNSIQQPASTPIAPPISKRGVSMPIWVWAVGGVAFLAFVIGAMAWIAGNTNKPTTPIPLTLQTETKTASQIISSTITATPTAVSSLPNGGFCDRFSGTTLDSRWEWIDPLGGSKATVDSQGLTLSTTGGKRDFYLDGNNFNAPRLLQNTSAGDLQVTTKVTLVSPFARNVMAFQSGALLLYKDRGNYIWIGLGTSMPNVDGAQAVNGKLSGIIFSTTKPSILQRSLYLRITRRGDEATTAYSLDGQIWTRSSGISFSRGNAQVGLILFSAWDSPGFSANFNSFLWDECAGQ